MVDLLDSFRNGQLTRANVRIEENDHCVSGCGQSGSLREIES